MCLASLNLSLSLSLSPLSAMLMMKNNHFCHGITFQEKIKKTYFNNNIFLNFYFFFNFRQVDLTVVLSLITTSD